MKGIPEISIIVPVYNAGKYLHNCIDSILEQTVKDFELILVDDGSNDGSGKICDEYSAKDDRVRVIHKKNGGASTARKAGVEAAAGRYIGWVDADDRVAEDMFEILHELAQKYDSDIAECQYLMIKGDKKLRSGKEEEIVSGNGNFILNQFFTSKMKPCFWNKLYKAHLLKNVQWPRRQYHVDTYVNMRLALMPLKYVRTPEVKYYYLMRENSNITTYDSRMMREAIYKYEDTMGLADTVDSKTAKNYLRKDAVRRLLGRYFEISVNSDIKDQKVYNACLRKKLGVSLPVYLLTAELPLKTRVSLSLLLLDLKYVQRFLHKYLGEKSNN